MHYAITGRHTTVSRDTMLSSAVNLKGTLHFKKSPFSLADYNYSVFTSCIKMYKKLFPHSSVIINHGIKATFHFPSILVHNVNQKSQALNRTVLILPADPEIV